MLLDPRIKHKNNREYKLFYFVIGTSIVKHKTHKNKDDRSEQAFLT